MTEFRKMYSFMINPIFTQAGHDVDSRPFSVPQLSSYMKSPDWDMRICLFAAYSISPHLSVRVASAYAHGSMPPLGSAVRNRHVVILHDGYLRFYNNSGKAKNDGYGSIPDDLNRAFSDAFQIGISCEAECVDPSDKSSEQVSLADIVEAVKAKVEQAITANRASSTIVVVVWIQEACKTDQSYSRLTSMMNISQGQEKIAKPSMSWTTWADGLPIWSLLVPAILICTSSRGVAKMPLSSVLCLTEHGLPPLPEPSCQFRLSIFLNLFRLSVHSSCPILRSTFLG